MVDKKNTTTKKKADDEESLKASKKKSSSSHPADKKVKKSIGGMALKSKKKLEEVEPEYERPALRGPYVTPPPAKPIAVVAPPTARPAVVSTPAPHKEKPAVIEKQPASAHLPKATSASAVKTMKVAESTVAAPVHPPKIEAPKFTVKKPTPPVPVAPPPPIVKKEPAPKKKKLPEPSPQKTDQKSAAGIVGKQGEDSSRKKIFYNEMMTVKDLSEAMGVKIIDVIKKLLLIGTPASINQRLETDVATLVADSFGCELELKSIYEEEKVEAVEEAKDLSPRPPVVTVMGHVDHGKTSLLDAIRETRVAAGEAGGITQHIGAYQVKTTRGVITFLDTPGHEAFTAMRARGAHATDLVVLVVAADDSVMPQTVEAIDHARAANVPIVVAINKTDLPQANVQKVKQELAQHNLLAEDWGGKTVMVEVSAKTKKNIDKLLEMILLETELLELKANPNRPAKGVVLEAKMDPRRGVTATILIQAGTLKVGDPVVCGLTSGRVRAMLNEIWSPVQTVGPATPVAILGLGAVPQVGDQLMVVGGDKEAREIVEKRKTYMTESSRQGAQFLSLESLHDQIEQGTLKELRVILKTDVQGSMQALQDSLAKLSTSAIQIRFVHVGIGNINESDVLLAEASNAIIFGFNVKIEHKAESEAKLTGVDIRTYQIIYEMLADVKAAMEGLLQPEEREVVKGHAVVKTVFSSSRLGIVAGCQVMEGKVTRGGKARVIRNGTLIGSGTISSLKRFKDDVKEVEKGFECGLFVEGVKSYEAGDVVEIFVIEKHARRLES